eukprot:TRINITY_DN27825_c0_g2_i1.p1 TRINITY_DN27825_c0_g2~~TRINITY_DN27825_c0_g2_i1.p1  ORF type:complete len:754 (+),score=125.94 TRINITY_DN27825_c0_g2_i1:139-2400(+)
MAMYAQPQQAIMATQQALPPQFQFPPAPTRPPLTAIPMTQSQPTVASAPLFPPQWQEQRLSAARLPPGTQVEVFSASSGGAWVAATVAAPTPQLPLPSPGAVLCRYDVDGRAKWVSADDIPRVLRLRTSQVRSAAVPRCQTADPEGPEAVLKRTNIYKGLLENSQPLMGRASPQRAPRATFPMGARPDAASPGADHTMLDQTVDWHLRQLPGNIASACRVQRFGGGVYTINGNTVRLELKLVNGNMAVLVSNPSGGAPELLVDYLRRTTVNATPSASSSAAPPVALPPPGAASVSMPPPAATSASKFDFSVATQPGLLASLATQPGLVGSVAMPPSPVHGLRSPSQLRQAPNMPPSPTDRRPWQFSAGQAQPPLSTRGSVPPTQYPPSPTQAAQAAPLLQSHAPPMAPGHERPYLPPATVQQHQAPAAAPALAPASNGHALRPGVADPNASFAQLAPPPPPPAAPPPQCKSMYVPPPPPRKPVAASPTPASVSAPPGPAQPAGLQAARPPVPPGAAMRDMNLGRGRDALTASQSAAQLLAPPHLLSAVPSQGHIPPVASAPCAAANALTPGASLSASFPGAPHGMAGPGGSPQAAQMSARGPPPPEASGPSLRHHQPASDLPQGLSEYQRIAGMRPQAASMHAMGTASPMQVNRETSAPPVMANHLAGPGQRTPQMPRAPPPFAGSLQAPPGPGAMAGYGHGAAPPPQVGPPAVPPYMRTASPQRRWSSQAKEQQYQQMLQRSKEDGLVMRMQ